MNRSYFADIAPIAYEGPDSKNALAFRFYDKNRLVMGKTMEQQLRMAVCYWHTFRGMGGDPFGPGCAVRPWEDGTDSVDMAVKRAHVAFEPLVIELQMKFAESFRRFAH